MKRKHWKTKCLSWLLVFSLLVSGLATGQVIGSKEAEAVGEASIDLDKPNMQKGSDGTYYTYPEAVVNAGEKKISELTIRVDSGHIRVTDDKIDGVAGYGIESGSSMNESYQQLTTEDRYEAVIFSWPQGTDADNVQSYLRNVRYTTSMTPPQTVIVSAVTMPETGKVTTTIDGRTFDLHYFDGHYYGYITNTLNWPVKWTDAFEQSRKASIDQAPKVKGYLTTLTSRAEDRFLLHTFQQWENNAYKGWIGCNRLALSDNTDWYNDDVVEWKEPAEFSPSSCEQNFVWRWVCGPEAGDAFGYQNAAYGDNIPDANGMDDGGFVTKSGWFSNWNNSSNIEPNGGAATDEAYGYYGKYEYGRWNDNENISGDGVDGYYIEFGGMDGNDEALQETLGQEILTTTETTTETITDDTYIEEDKKTKISGVVKIENPTQNKDEDGNPIREVGTTVTANVTGIIPAGAQDHLTYQWYYEDVNDKGVTVIKKITSKGDGKNYTLTSETFDKVLLVTVTGKDDYYGDVTSVPFDDRVRITGTVKIVNDTKDDNGNPICKEGTILSADVAGVKPDTSHPYLEYEWIIQNGTETITIPGETGSHLTLTEELIDQDIKVIVKGADRYTGTLTSDPYDTTRTNAGINVSDPDGETKVLTIIPTMPNHIYAVKDEEGNVLDNLPAVDQEGNPVTPDVDDPGYHGYYAVEPGTIVYVTVEKDKNYIIVEVEREADQGKDKVNTEIIGPDIPSKNIKPDYDDNDTKNPIDDKITITVDPADGDYKYAILKKEDGIYVGVNVTKDEGGNYVADPESHITWTDGGEDIVTFTDLPADGVYRIVAVSVGENISEELKNVRPEDITGGSKDIIVTQDKQLATPTPKPTLPAFISPAPTVEPSDDPNQGGDTTPTPTASDGSGGDTTPTPDTSSQPSDSGSPAPSQTPDASATAAVSPTPGASATTTANPYTQAENDAAEQFIQTYVTATDGNMIVAIDDLTRDIIVSGETTWNAMSDREKQAVNSKLKERGNPYTYEQLLEMAKAYKIPGFKLRKEMKKKTKAKLKLVKCQGATIICTSTNPKVATVNKKGVIKAKKVGKATITFTAVKGDYSNRLVVNIIVRKKFKNAKELKKFKSNVIKTPTVLIAKKRVLKKSTKLRVYNLEPDATVQYKSFNKKVLKITAKGKYTGKKTGASLVRVTINQNNKVYYLYINVSIFKKGKKRKK